MLTGLRCGIPMPGGHAGGWWRSASESSSRESMLMARIAFDRRAVLIVTAALLAGCGGDPSKPKLGRVSGTVTYKGKPVTKGIVTFIPISGPGSKTGQSAMGEIGKDGSYVLTTFENGDGAVLGEHIVLVQSREDDPALEGHDMPIPDAQGRVKIKPSKNLVPAKYATAEESPLRQTVVAGRNAFPIELKD